MIQATGMVTTEMVSDGIGIFASLGIAIAVSLVVAGIVAGLVMTGVTKGLKTLFGHSGVHKDDLRYEEEKELAEALAADNEQKDLIGSVDEEEPTKKKQLASR